MHMREKRRVHFQTEKKLTSKTGRSSFWQAFKVIGSWSGIRGNYSKWNLVKYQKEVSKSQRGAKTGLAHSGWRRTHHKWYANDGPSDMCWGSIQRHLSIRKTGSMYLFNWKGSSIYCADIHPWKHNSDQDKQSPCPCRAKCPRRRTHNEQVITKDARDRGGHSGTCESKEERNWHGTHLCKSHTGAEPSRPIGRTSLVVQG